MTKVRKDLEEIFIAPLGQVSRRTGFLSAARRFLTLVRTEVVCPDCYRHDEGDEGASLNDSLPEEPFLFHSFTPHSSSYRPL